MPDGSNGPEFSEAEIYENLSNNDAYELQQLKKFLNAPATPQKREDCVAGPRPCPHLRCRYHLASDETYKGAPRIHNLPANSPTCALDLAALGGIQLNEIAQHMAIVPEAAAQLEVRGLRKVRLALARIDSEVYNAS